MADAKIDEAGLEAALLPCPFCGGEAVAENYAIEAGVRCLSCRAKIIRSHGARTDNGYAESCEAWNRRTLAQASEPGVKADGLRESLLAYAFEIEPKAYAVTPSKSEKISRRIYAEISERLRALAAAHPAPVVDAGEKVTRAEIEIALDAFLSVLSIPFVPGQPRPQKAIREALLAAKRYVRSHPSDAGEKVQPVAFVHHDHIDRLLAGGPSEQATMFRVPPYPELSKHFVGLYLAQPQASREAREVDHCVACELPIQEGEMVLREVGEGGLIHAACCGPEPESYVDANDEPLKPGDPLPKPFPYRALQRKQTP